MGRCQNNFFGHSITATGLLTGQDVLKKIKDIKEHFDAVILPKNMMRETENVFLDDMTLEDFSQKIQKPVVLISPDGASFFKALSGNLEQND